MQNPVFKGEFEPMNAKEKKEFRQLMDDLRKANKDPRFKKFVSEMKRHHLGLKQ